MKAPRDPFTGEPEVRRLLVRYGGTLLMLSVPLGTPPSVHAPVVRRAIERAAFVMRALYPNGLEPQETTCPS